VSQIAKVENVLVVNPGIAANSVPELLALAKAQPGKISFASPGVGSQAHLAGEFLRLRGNVDLLHIAYKGVGPALNDVLGGQVSMMFAAIPSAQPHVKAGKLRALGVASLQRSSAMPDVPTVAEQNLPGFEAGLVVLDPGSGGHAEGDRRADQRRDRTDARAARNSREARWHRGDRDRRKHPSNWPQ
jgi:tripartite-type tricarboxylate transporter receptor subunit TctC